MRPDSATGPSGAQLRLDACNRQFDHTPETSPASAGQRSFREVCQAAICVFNMTNKYHTAPYPNACAVLFAYPTGSDEDLVAAINSLLQLKEPLSP